MPPPPSQPPPPPQPTVALFRALSAAWRATGVPLPTPYAHLRSPKMHIRNRCFETVALRKVHVEHAVTRRVQVLHAVAYPRVDHALPILGVDLVGIDGVPSMAIADASLPGVPEDAVLHAELRALQARHGLADARTRALPEWGQGIFSSSCLFLATPDADAFSAYVMDVTALYARAAAASRPDPTRARHLATAHRTYCEHQLRNARTRAVLADAFGPEAAYEYMRGVMFDAPAVPDAPAPAPAPAPAGVADAGLEQET
jgi:phycocyanobilin:ferredoxin oxidoreductase